jgi:hypothetical protein
MENEDIIRLAVQLTEENNSLYKNAARNQAFIIKAEDSSGTVDTFITVQGPETADQWKNQFSTAGFGNVVVSPFRSSGNLSFSDVDPAFFAEISKRAKWQVTHSPTGYDTPFTDYNPYAGSDVGFDTSNPRTPMAASYSLDDTNKYQNYIDKDLLKEPKYKVFAGWYNGSLIDWINKLIPISDQIKDILEKQYAYLYGNAPLQKYLLDKDIEPKSFAPTKFQINTLGIKMYSLYAILSTPDIELDDFPEGLILPEMQNIVNIAKAHKFFKQYEQSDMDQFQNNEIQEKSDKDVRTWNLIKKILRGVSR